MVAKDNRLAKRPSPFHKRRRYIWLLSFVLFLICAVFIATIFIRHQREQALIEERQRFLQAEKDVEEIKNAIIAKIGEPVRTEQNNHCSRPSTKWSEGELSCRTVRNVFYGLTNAAEANQYLTYSKSVIPTDWRESGVRFSSNINQTQGFVEILAEKYIPNASYQLVVADYAKDNMRCSVTGTYYLATKPPFPSYAIPEDAWPFALNIEADCGEGVKKAQYKILD